MAAPLPRPRSGINGILAKGCFHVWGGEGAGGMFPDHFNVVFCDGAVRKVSKKVDPETLKKLITPAGGEPVGFEAIE